MEEKGLAVIGVCVIPEMINVGGDAFFHHNIAPCQYFNIPD